MAYLELGRARFLSAARFQGLNFSFSSGLNWPVVRVEVSRSATAMAGAAAVSAAACDDAHRIEAAVYVWRGNWENGRLRAGLASPRRLAMVNVRETTAGSERHAELGSAKGCGPAFTILGNFLGHGRSSTGQTYSGLGLDADISNPFAIKSLAQ